MSIIKKFHYYIVIMKHGKVVLFCCNNFWPWLHYNYKSIDVNECESGTSGCSQLCSNTVGSFECSCNDGYETGY